MIEKEASAKDYMYNYPPKAGEDLKLEDAGDKDQKAKAAAKAGGNVADKEQAKIKKQYEDIIETNRKNFDV